MSYSSVNFESLGQYNTARQGNSSFVQANSSLPSVVYTNSKGVVTLFTFSTKRQRAEINALLNMLRTEPTLLSKLSSTLSKPAIKAWFKTNHGIGSSVTNQLLGK